MTKPRQNTYSKARNYCLSDVFYCQFESAIQVWYYLDKINHIFQAVDTPGWTISFMTWNYNSLGLKVSFCPLTKVSKSLWNNDRCVFMYLLSESQSKRWIPVPRMTLTTGTSVPPSRMLNKVEDHTWCSLSMFKRQFLTLALTALENYTKHHHFLFRKHAPIIFSCSQYITETLCSTSRVSFLNNFY